MDELQIKMDLVKQAKGRTSHQQSTTFFVSNSIIVIVPTEKNHPKQGEFCIVLCSEPQSKFEAASIGIFPEVRCRW